jgi:hypothetical protein
VDEDRGFGPAGAPPPPPPVGTPAGGEPPPPPPAAPPATPAPGWGVEPGPSGPQGWVSPTEVPPAWGAASPSAEVGWDRPPSGNNGCLRACLIVGGILVVAVIVGGIALSIFVGQIIEQVQENPDAVFGGECQVVSSFEVGEALGQDVEVLALEGLADGTMGAILDKRLLPDATDCWILGDGTTGRIAVVDTDAETVFRNSRAEAEASFLQGDVDEIGDEAFCTTINQQGSGGVLVRFDQRVVYVSLVAESFDDTSVCETAQAVARTLEP